MPRLLVMFTAAAAVLAAATAAAAPGGDGVWVNGQAERLITGPPPTAGASRPAILYVISPVSTAHPLHAAADAITHGFGAHDHVLALAKGKSRFKGTCSLRLVVPGAKGRPGVNIAVRSTTTPLGKKPLLHAARLGAVMRPLSSAPRIEAAVRLGLAAIVDTESVISCTVSP